jgi:hypothetical protein
MSWHDRMRRVVASSVTAPGLVDAGLLVAVAAIPPVLNRRIAPIGPET